MSRMKPDDVFLSYVALNIFFLSFDSIFNSPIVRYANGNRFHILSLVFFLVLDPTN